MDIRDITQEPEKTDNKLKTIFSLQKELLNHYQKIEGLPKYPIEVNVKASQVILKDFIGRITEELAEGLESLDKILMVKDKYQDVTRSGEHYKGTVVPMIQNFNEECADALHFAVELLIFSGVDEDMVMSYVHTYIMNLEADEYSIEDGKRVPTDWLQLLVKAARSRNSRNGMLEWSFPEKMDAMPIILAEDMEPYNPGCRRLDDTVYKNLMLLYANCTLAFNIARNTLKNKPWKQTQMKTDEANYRMLIIEGFVKLIEFFEFAGLTEDDIYFLYYKKNMVNKFRIKSKY